MPLDPRGRDTFVAHSPLPPSALSDVERWGELLVRWNSKINLVAPGTLGDFWVRHALDSAQIVSHLPDTAAVVADFGSGAGFPGIAIAIDAKHRGLPRHVHLIESAGKKASFLRTVTRELALPVTVHSARIEALKPLQADVITARAFAPLPRLLPLARRHLAPEGRVVLLKGEGLDGEIAEACASGERFDTVHTAASLSGDGYICVVAPR